MNYPEPGRNILKFTNYQNVIEVPIMFVADNESVYMIWNSTEQYQKYKCAATGVHLIKFPNENKHFSLVERNASEKGLEFIEQEVKNFLRNIRNQCCFFMDVMEANQAFHGERKFYVCLGDLVCYRATKIT